MYGNKWIGLVTDEEIPASGQSDVMWIGTLIGLI